MSKKGKRKKEKGKKEERKTNYSEIVKIQPKKLNS